MESQLVLHTYVGSNSVLLISGPPPASPVVQPSVLATVSHGYRTYTEGLHRGCRCQSCGITCSMVETEDHPEGGKSADTRWDENRGIQEDASDSFSSPAHVQDLLCGRVHVTERLPTDRTQHVTR